jgi:hypothetical protein
VLWLRRWNQEDIDKAGTTTLTPGWWILLAMIVEWSDTIASAFCPVGWSGLKLYVLAATLSAMPETDAEVARFLTQRTFRSFSQLHG